MENTHRKLEFITFVVISLFYFTVAGLFGLGVDDGPPFYKGSGSAIYGLLFGMTGCLFFRRFVVKDPWAWKELSQLTTHIDAVQGPVQLIGMFLCVVSFESLRYSMLWLMGPWAPCLGFALAAGLMTRSLFIFLYFYVTFITMCTIHYQFDLTCAVITSYTATILRLAIESRERTGTAKC